jgi:ferrochelatase
MFKKPSDHPKILNNKIGVLLINLGTPNNTDTKSIRIYLKEFLSDPRVIDLPRILWWFILNLIILNTRPRKTGAAYKKIWLTNDEDGSPLRKFTRLQSENLLKAFNNDKLIIDFAMRYGSPSISAKLEKLKSAGCERILIFSLYPQYSAPTTATVNDEIFKWMIKQKWQPSIRIVPPYFDRPEYISAISKSILRSFKEHGEPNILLLSFHGAPMRYLIEGDPYHCQCIKTARLIKEYLNIDDKKFMISFQSRFGNEPWLKPYTDETLEKLGKENINHLSIITPGFSSDNIETLEEIDIEGRKTFLSSGGRKFTYIPCLNDTHEGMELLHKLTMNELAGWI